MVSKDHHDFVSIITSSLYNKITSGKANKKYQVVQKNAFMKESLNQPPTLSTCVCMSSSHGT